MNLEVVSINLMGTRRETVIAEGWKRKDQCFELDAKRLKKYTVYSQHNCGNDVLESVNTP